MSLDRRAQKIVIAGASSLLGAEVKAVLEESRFAGWDLRLVDEEDVAGTLTEAGGEATLIQKIEEDTFRGARFAFFTGSPEFTERNFQGALAAGAQVIDFTGRVWTKDPPCAWFPKLHELWVIPPFSPKPLHFWVISSAGVAASSLTLGLREVGLKRISFVFFRPVSEAGRPGTEELESQTAHLLSFQSIGQPVFDAQVAFNMLHGYGPESRQNLDSVRDQVCKEASWCIEDLVSVLPSIEMLHAPTFYGMAFSACAELDTGKADPASVRKACQNAGFVIVEEDGSPSNVTVAGEPVIQMAVPRPDPGSQGNWWFWGVADNIRLPAWNAVKLAELLEP